MLSGKIVLESCQTGLALSIALAPSGSNHVSPTNGIPPMSASCLTSSGAASGSKGALSHAVTRGVSLGVSSARVTTTMTESLEDTDALRKNDATARVRSGACTKG